MLKNIAILVAVSFLVIFSVTYAHSMVQLILSGHAWVSEYLMEIFSGGKAGLVTRQLLALLAIPLLVGSVLGLIYWVVKRSMLPYLMQIIWVTWLIQLAGLVVLNRGL